MIDPSDSSTLYAGTVFRGFFKSVDGGATWVASSQDFAIALQIAVDPVNPSTLYVSASFRGLFKSVDGGESWFRISDRDTRAVAIDPRRTSTLYAGGLQGLFKSEDGGATWRAANRGLGSPPLTVLDIVILARDSDRLVIAVEGSFPSDDGVFRSVDGGESWTPTSDAPLEATAIADLVADPRSSSVLYAGTGRGVFRSEDGGNSWRNLTRLLEVRTVAVDPERSSVLYAGTTDGFFKSVDAGANWFRQGRGLESAMVQALVIDPREPDVLYAGTEGAGIFKSVDRAGSWRPSPSGPPNDDVRTLVSDPRFPLTLYAGGDTGLYKSLDGGLTWRRLDPPVRDLTDLVIDPAGTLYLSTEEGGVYKSLDGGATFRDSSHHITRLAADRLVIDPTDPSTLYAGFSSNGVYKTVDGGGRWTAAKEGLPGEDFFFGGLVIHPRDGRILYAGLFPGRFNREKGVYKSLDGGVLWFHTGFDAAIRALAIDPFNPSTLYAGISGSDGAEVYKSTDGGQTWLATGEGLFRESSIEALAVDPNRPDSVLAGTSAGVFRTVDGGATWTALSAGMPAPAPVVYDVMVPRGAPTTIYAGASSTSDSAVGGVYEWTEVDCGPGPGGSGGCLGQGRFFVEVRWQDFAGKTGRARNVPVSSDSSAVLWFFEPENWEMLVKVLDGCAIDGHYWFYASAATNVGYTVRVADLTSGVTRTYVNRLGQRASAIVDNRAFATCP